MPGAADFIQKAVHTLEAGGLAVWIKRSLLVIAILAVALIYLFNFRGLATSQAMDQAQIGREIASGHLWHTKFARPLAVAQLQANGKNVQRRIWHDTYHAPLPPLANAIALFPLKSHWEMSPRDLVYLGDKAIAAMGMCFFLGSIVLLYFVARRLFDNRLALLACGLVLVCDMLWQYSLSGLPQMMLLFLFNVTLYAIVRAVEAQYAGGRVGVWLAAVGVGFGLLALTHALTIWMFVGALIFFIVFFRPRGWAAIIVLAVFMIIYLPWLARNYVISGNPGGVAIYSILDGVRQSEAGWMRRVDLDLQGVGPGAFRQKFITNLIAQGGQIFSHLGWSIVALMFFASLLHVFKRPETSVVRWIVLAMWGGAVIGMALFGIHEEQGVAANQLHLLFFPIMTCYGLAYLLVQWNRLGVEFRIARIAFITLLFLLCGFPMFTSIAGLLFGKSKTLIRWPPYVPPYIAVLNKWMKPEEITASDMPWAIAWYADRRSIWVPETVKVFTDFNDYNVLGAPVNGLYLTPISGSSNTFRDIVKGEYRDWAAVIQRSVIVERFPLKWATLLGLENECVFFSDHDRQGVPAP